MIRRGASLAAWGICLTLLVALWPVQLGGWASYTVVSGSSMEPLYETGDLVVGWSTGAYAPGDVVVYTVPEGDVGAGHQVIHRLVGETDDGWVAQGDNKGAPDPWTPTDADIVGEAVLHVPAGGRVLALLPILLALIAGALVAVALWPRRETPDDAHRTEGRSSSRGRHAAPRPDGLTGASSTISALVVGLVVGVACPALATGPGDAAGLGGVSAARLGTWVVSTLDMDEGTVVTDGIGEVEQ